MTQAFENVKNLHFNGMLLTKVCHVWAKKKYRGVFFLDTENWCKIWRKTDLCFQKWQEFDKLSPEHSKVSKLGFWWDPFIQSRKYMSLKFMAESIVMAMKNNAKFEEELMCQFKIDLRILTNFHPSIQISKIAL